MLRIGAYKAQTPAFEIFLGMLKADRRSVCYLLELPTVSKLVNRAVFSYRFLMPRGCLNGS